MKMITVRLTDVMTKEFIEVEIEAHQLHTNFKNKISWSENKILFREVIQSHR